MPTYNQCIFTGRVAWAQEKKIGPSWGVINTKIELPRFEFDYNGAHQMVNDPILWMSIKANYDQGNISCPDVLSSASSGRYICVGGATISSFNSPAKDTEGKPIPNAPPIERFTMEVSSNAVNFSEVPYPEVNECTFCGYVDSVDSSGWIVLRTSYKVKKETKYRKVKILCDPSLVSPALKNNQLLVIGSVCGKTPTRDSELYVVAKNFFSL